MKENKLKVFQTYANGTFIVGKYSFSVLVTDKGKFLLPKNESEQNELLNNPGFGRTYWEVEQKEIGDNSDIRLYQILKKDKVEMLFALAEDKRNEAIRLLNHNVSEIIAKVSGREIPNNEEGDEKKVIPFDDIIVEQLKAMLDDEGITYDKKANKQVLYDLAFPK